MRMSDRWMQNFEKRIYIKILLAIDYIPPLINYATLYYSQSWKLLINNMIPSFDQKKKKNYDNNRPQSVKYYADTYFEDKWRYHEIRYRVPPNIL